MIEIFLQAHILRMLVIIFVPIRPRKRDRRIGGPGGEEEQDHNEKGSEAEKRDIEKEKREREKDPNYP